MSPPQPAGLEAAVLAQAADAIIHADRDGIVRLWNRGAEALFGYAAAEAIGQSLDLIIPEQFRHAHDTGYARAMASGQVRNAGRILTTRARSKDGARLYVDFSFALVKDEAGAVLGAVAVGRDCTAAWLEKAAERERQAAAAKAAPP